MSSITAPGLQTPQTDPRKDTDKNNTGVNKNEQAQAAQATEGEQAGRAQGSQQPDRFGPAVIVSLSPQAQALLAANASQQSQQQEGESQPQDRAANG